MSRKDKGKQPAEEQNYEKHKRAEQNFKFEFANYKPNRAPCWNRKRLLHKGKEASNTRKRRIVISEERDKVSFAFYTEMELRLKNKIQKCYSVEGDMNELKQKFIEASQLERGMVLDAEKKADIPKGHITNWLRHSKMKSIDCWKDFVHDNFDRLKSETNQKNISACFTF